MHMKTKHLFMLYNYGKTKAKYCFSYIAYLCVKLCLFTILLQRMVKLKVKLLRSSSFAIQIMIVCGVQIYVNLLHPIIILFIMFAIITYLLGII